ncbi:shikimate kinase AroK [Gordonia sinesedis]
MTPPTGDTPTGDTPVAGGHDDHRRPIVVLIGFMGAGKSTVGRILADRFATDFVDTDEEIVRRTGRSIPEIFADGGVARFREIERDIVLGVLASHPGVVSLGGGAVTTGAVAEALTAHRVVHLRIGADTGYARVAGTDRPLLAGADPEASYRGLLDERSPTYARLATVDVDAAAGTPEEIADYIATEIAGPAGAASERTP